MRLHLSVIEKEMIIRKVELGDVENLTVLKQQVWIATYAVEGIRTELSSYVLSVFTVANQRKLLLDNNVVLFVAEINSHIVGCVEVKLYSGDAIAEGLPEITVLYVLERFCGRGVGQKLLETAFNLLREKGYTSTWLSVLHTNKKALKFYDKNGFKDIGKIYFEMDGNKYENRVLLCAI